MKAFQNAFSSNKFVVTYFSPEFFQQIILADSGIEGVFLNLVHDLLRGKALEGWCQIESEELKREIESQFKSKIEFKNDYIQNELFKSSLFEQLCQKSERKFGEPTAEVYYSLRLQSVSVQAIHMIMKNLK